MSIQAVKEYFRPLGREKDILELDASSATVELAAKALGCEGARIAKTLSFLVDEKAVLVVCAGDGKVDNARFKAQFHQKAKMLTPEQAEEMVGHKVGGVCPFGVKPGVEVYLDVSLKRFDIVYPACGSANSAIALTCEELEEYSHARGWVDVCKNWRPDEQ